MFKKKGFILYVISLSIFVILMTGCSTNTQVKAEKEPEKIHLAKNVRLVHVYEGVVDGNNLYFIEVKKDDEKLKLITTTYYGEKIELANLKGETVSIKYDNSLEVKGLSFKKMGNVVELR